MRLAEPLSISFHTWTHQENVLIHMHDTDSDVAGLGEAAPYKPITLDSQDDVFQELQTLGTIDVHPNQVSIEDFHHYLTERGLKSHTARAALDFAYHDLQGKLRGVPSYELYTQQKNTPPSSITVFITDAQTMQQKVQDILQTYPDLKVLKIKLAGNEQDMENVQAIADVTPEGLQFVVDANQGFAKPDDAVSSLKNINDILGSILLVEEPLPKGHLDDLKIVKEAMDGTMLVFADESAVDTEDARRIIEMQAAHGINIKLQKAGGIWQGRQMAKLAEEAGLKVMVGCMLEGPVSIAAGVHFAAATQNVILSDLDTDLSQPEAVKEICPCIDGSRQPLALPGLGIELDESRIHDLAAKETLVWERVV